MTQSDWLDQVGSWLAFSLLVSSFVMIAVLLMKKRLATRRDRSS